MKLFRRVSCTGRAACVSQVLKRPQRSFTAPSVCEIRFLHQSSGFNQLVQLSALIALLSAALLAAGHGHRPRVPGRLRHGVDGEELGPRGATPEGPG